MATADPHGYFNDLNIYGAFLDNYDVDASVMLGDLILNAYDSIGEPLSNYNYWSQTLRVVGNHDALKNWTSAPRDWTNQVTQQQLYDRYFATNNPVTMQSGKTYWAKEYDNVLIIGGNCMLISMQEQAEQLIFFSDKLNYAKENNLTVVICYHWPLNVPYFRLDTNFSVRDIGSYYAEGRPHGEIWSQTQTFENNLLALVDNFITNGGSFACWLNGHEHWDDVGMFIGEHANQLYINIASYHYLWNLVHYDVATYTCGLAFNRIDIDTENKTVEICRYGANYGMNICHLTKCKLSFNGQVLEVG